MQRFFVTFPLGVDVRLVDQDMISQITRVLRMKEGESLILFDGDGSETEYEIQKIEKKILFLRGKNRTFPRTEPTIRVTLFQALPNKHEKIEYILQKGVEVGIRRFVFFRSDRSQKIIISPSKEERFRVIAREALEQCGGVVMPSIDFIEGGSFVSLFQTSVFRSRTSPKDEYPETQDQEHELKGITNVVLDTTGKQARISDFRDIQDVGLWVGPEGGWSEDERGKMSQYGFIFAHFSERVFRTETAGVITAFALMNQ